MSMDKARKQLREDGYCVVDGARHAAERTLLGEGPLLQSIAFCALGGSMHHNKLEQVRHW